jgi:hypothetical protein
MSLAQIVETPIVCCFHFFYVVFFVFLLDFFKGFPLLRETKKDIVGMGIYENSP